MTNTDWIRQRLYLGAGLKPEVPPPFQGKSLDDILREQIKDGFIQHMNRRMAMGELRYGKSSQKNDPVFYLRQAMLSLCSYNKTGNLECLIDAANYLRLEWRHSQHPNRHFHAKDRV